MENPNEEERKLTSEELHTALKEVAAFFCVTLMSANLQGVEVPGNIKKTMDNFMNALPQLADMIDTMDHQLEIEKDDDKGGSSNG